MIQSQLGFFLCSCYTHRMLVCYTGGGTLGHIYPALAVHQVLKNQDAYQCFWIGRKNEAEMKAVESAGIRFYPIQSGKFRRYSSYKNFTDLFNLLVAFFQALAILNREKPDVLFSKGGFVSVPPVFAARLLNIRVVTHESDASPGLATRLNAFCATRICIPFAGSEASLPTHKIVVTGNPLRSELFEIPEKSLKERLGIEPSVPLLFVMGGSQGAMQINELVRTNLDALCSKAFVYHQCGSADYVKIEHENYLAFAMVGNEMGSLYRESTLVVSRGGAGSLGELSAFGCAAIIIPLSLETSRGDQILNARHLEDAGAARILWGAVTPEIFLQEVLDLLENQDKRSILAETMKTLAVTDAAEKIATVLRKEE